MNLVGKILTVLIFVMSLVFMSFAVAVYATHKNWREVVLNDTAAPGKPLGLTYQLKNEQQRYDELQRDLNRLEKDLTAEKHAAVQKLTELRSELLDLQGDYNDLNQQCKQIDEERASLEASLKTSLAELSALRTDVEGDPDDPDVPGLRKRVRDAEKARDQFFNEALRLSDQLHQAIIELNRLEAYQRTLTQDLNKARAVLRKFGLKPEPALYVDQPPDDLHGVVQAVTREGHVEISIGSDEGLLPKHRLEVYRPTGYVARIEVVKTDVDRSVCQIVPGTQLSRVQKDDLVASKLLR